MPEILVSARKRKHPSGGYEGHQCGRGHREDVPRFLSDEADFQDGFQNRAGGDAVRERVRDDKGKCGVHGLCYCLQQDTKRPAGAVQSAVPHETEQISIYQGKISIYQVICHSTVTADWRDGNRGGLIGTTASQGRWRTIVTLSALISSSFSPRIR